jgi:hypothetical protein
MRSGPSQPPRCKCLTFVPGGGSSRYKCKAICSGASFPRYKHMQCRQCSVRMQACSSSIILHPPTHGLSPSSILEHFEPSPPKPGPDASSGMVMGRIFWPEITYFFSPTRTRPGPKNAQVYLHLFLSLSFRHSHLYLLLTFLFLISHLDPDPAGAEAGAARGRPGTGAGAEPGAGPFDGRRRGRRGCELVLVVFLFMFMGSCS